MVKYYCDPRGDYYSNSIPVKFVFSKREDINRITQWIRGVIFDAEFDFSSPWEIVIRRLKDPRSLAQNNLYWKWMEELAETGYTKEAWHETFKEWFLDYKEVTLISGEVRYIRPSTTQLSKKKFTEYLNQIETWVATDGPKIHLPHPDDYGLAMGIR